MPREVIMPALGMAQDSGLIVAWHKSPGDAVAEGDVLFEVETDKATMEVEAQSGGFLTQIRRPAGDDVPVGEVIALIGDTAEAVHTEETLAGAAAPAAQIPEGNEVIMPALGMAQDSGLIVAWHKAPGDPVLADDVLFEVETDKATMEVEAGHDGFVGALLAEAGEEASVGEAIAVISAEKPETPVQLSRKAQPPDAAAPAPGSAPKPATAPAPAKPACPANPALVSETGRILASPKARRLALEQGLDLARLAETGHPQPYHVSDLEVLKALPGKVAGTAPAAASRHLVAELSTDGFAKFAGWAAEKAGLTDSGALLAGLAAASLDKTSVVAVECFGQTRSYATSARLGETVESEATPELRLRDLRFSPVSAVQMGAEDTPVLTIARSNGGLTITLECAGHHLSATEAVTLLSNFAGRMEQPLRHLF